MEVVALRYDIIIPVNLIHKLWECCFLRVAYLLNQDYVIT